MKRLYEIKETEQTEVQTELAITQNMETLFGETLSPKQAYALYQGIKRFEGQAATEKMNHLFD